MADGIVTVMVSSEVSGETYTVSNVEHQPNMGAAQLYAIIIYLSVFAFLGSVGNAIVIYVCVMKNDTFVATFFIIMLALVDFATCICAIPLTIYMEYKLFYVSDIMCKIYLFLLTCNIPFSAFLMTAIAVDRFLCICYPLSSVMTMRRAKILTFVLSLCAALLGLFVSLAYGTYQRAELKYTNATLYGNYSTTDLSVHLTSMNNRSDVVSLHYNDYDSTHTVAFERTTGERTVQHTRRQCSPNNIIISIDALMIFQKMYNCVFFVSAIVVSTLYALIFRSVKARHNKRQKQKSKVLHIVQNEIETRHMNIKETECTEIELKQKTYGKHANVGNGVDEITPREDQQMLNRHKEERRRKSTKKDKLRSSNTRMAFMLGTVTGVFIVTYIPAVLISLEVLPNIPAVFYLYFFNNVVNPFVYTFMNKNFRTDLKKAFQVCPCKRRYM